MAEFAVTGMTCANCARKVEQVLKSLSPDATVTLAPPRARIAKGVGVATVNEALAKIGKYRVTVAAAETNGWFQTYLPLLIVIGLVALAALAARSWMIGFMAGFFIVFGSFKLFDVPAFANAYAKYDVVAKQFRPWGYAYPFVETALGFAFLFQYQLRAMSWIALVLSVVGAIGVIQANLNKQTIQCACLGTVFQLPMSVVTIIENAGMAAMAAWMIYLR